MAAAANNLAGAGVPGCAWQLTVLELPIFMGVLRAERPSSAKELCRCVGGWFDAPLNPNGAPLANMPPQRSLTHGPNGFRATASGSRAVRPLVTDLVQMTDQGTRLLDVALMMTVVRLNEGELDGGDHDR